MILNTIPLALVGKANKSDPESKDRERENLLQKRNLITPFVGQTLL
jgi:hypothetical protein